MKGIKHDFTMPDRFPDVEVKPVESKPVVNLKEARERVKKLMEPLRKPAPQKPRRHTNG